MREGHHAHRSAYQRRSHFCFRCSCLYTPLPHFRAAVCFFVPSCTLRGDAPRGCTAGMHRRDAPRGCTAGMHRGDSLPQSLRHKSGSEPDAWRSPRPASLRSWFQHPATKRSSAWRARGHPQARWYRHRLVAFVLSPSCRRRRVVAVGSSPSQRVPCCRGYNETIPRGIAVQ